MKLGNEEENILNKDTKMNDKELIKRIYKNSNKKNFDYYDSLNIIKNKLFVMVQFIIIIFVSCFVSIVSSLLGYDYTYILSVLALLYVALTYTKLTKIEKMVEEIEQNEKLKDIKDLISKKWYELYVLMEKIPLDKERLEYNRLKFTLKIKECKTKQDYEQILKEILDEIEKYQNVMGENISQEEPKLTYVSKEITDAYYELELAPGSDFKQVKSRYRELMKRYHPDSVHYESEKARRLNEAYNKLKEFLE